MFGHVSTRVSVPGACAVRVRLLAGRAGATASLQADLLSASLMLVFMMASVTLSSMAVVTGELQQRFALSDAQVGLLTSVFMGFYGASGLLFGLFASRWGGRLLAVTCGCFVVGSLILGLSRDIGCLVAGRAIQGIGGGTVVSLCNPLITRNVPAARLGRCWGVFGCGWGVGQVVTLLMMPSIDRAGGFRAVFLTVAFMALVVGAVALRQEAVWAAPTRTEAVTDVRGLVTSLSAVVRTPRLLLLGLTCAAHLAVTVGVLAWTPSFLQAHRGATLAVAAYMTAGLGASQVAGNLAGAAAAVRWGKHKVILASLAIMTAAATLIAVMPGQMSALALVLVAGFCSFALFPPMIAYISEVVVKSEHVGPATGVHTVIGFAGSLVAPWLFGLVLDAGGRSTGSYLTGYLILGAFGIAALTGMAFFLPGRLSARTSVPRSGSSASLRPGATVQF